MDFQDVREILASVMKVKGQQPFYDIHAHPFEVMFDPRQYQPLPGRTGLFSAGSSSYVPPQLTPLNLRHSVPDRAINLDEHLRAKACQLKLRGIYSHTGPKVFADRMALSGIDKVLLLPVVGPDKGADNQMQTMCEIFGNDDRFLFGYCLPNGISNGDCVAEVRRVRAKFSVRALKVHPSVTGINPGGREGVERLEWILNASQQTNLPVIIHGGLSPDCQNRQAVAFGKLQNLRQIDWSITKQSVVIAHGGCYGHTTSEAQEKIIPFLIEMLDRHDNLYIDLSGLVFEVLCLLLMQIAPQRILFGSDALYESQWATLAKLWCGLRQSRRNPEEDLFRIAGMNPAKLLAQGPSVTGAIENQVESVPEA